MTDMNRRLVLAAKEILKQQAEAEGMCSKKVTCDVFDQVRTSVYKTVREAQKAFKVPKAHCPKLHMSELKEKMKKNCSTGHPLKGKSRRLPLFKEKRRRIALPGGL